MVGHNSMKNCILILLSCLLFSSALFAQQTAVLFQWEPTSGKKWKTFGDEAVQLKYEGEIKNGKPEGLGVSSLHGTTFFGNWKEGNKHGRGTYMSSFGLRYTGEFWQDRRDGKGTLTTSDGERYVGEFKEGKKHGQGIFTSPDGEKYVGEFRQDKFHGQGTYTWSSGTQYIGFFKKGLQSGQGTLTYGKGKL